MFLLVIFMFLFEKKRFLSVKFHNNNKSNAMQHLHIMYIDFYRSACTSSSNQTADIYFLVKKKQNKKWMSVIHTVNDQHYDVIFCTLLLIEIPIRFTLDFV
jgi:hypothetical protein